MKKKKKLEEEDEEEEIFQDEFENEEEIYEEEDEGKNIVEKILPEKIKKSEEKVENEKKLNFEELILAEKNSTNLIKNFNNGDIINEEKKTKGRKTISKLNSYKYVYEEKMSSEQMMGTFNDFSSEF